MAVGKNKILVYADWIDKFDKLTDEEAGKLIKHFFRYVNDLDPEYPDRLTELLFADIKNTLKRDLKKWDEIKQDKSNSGKIGNLKRWHPDLYKQYTDGKISIADAIKLSQTDRKPSQSIAVRDTVSVTDTVSDSVIVTDINKKDSKEFENSSPSNFKNNNTKNLKKENSKKVAPKKVFSEYVEKCYLECLEFFPDHLRPKNGNVDSWKDTIEKLNRLDKIPFELITQITQKTRGDDFWGKNFLSLTKLRKKNKDNIPYIVVFNEQIKQKNEQSRINRQTPETIESNFRGW